MTPEVSRLVPIIGQVLKVFFVGFSLFLRDKLHGSVIIQLSSNAVYPAEADQLIKNNPAIYVFIGYRFFKGDKPKTLTF